MSYIKIKLSEFKKNNQNNIFINPNGDSTIDYCDSDTIEKSILKILQSSNELTDGSFELMSKVANWPQFYHFDNRRANILKMLNLSQNSCVLEIGSGCGAISRYLGEHFMNVDCIEGSLQRAIITRERTRDLDNVTVYCSNIENIIFDKKYDIVTLIGVLEYAPTYLQGSPQEACKKMIELATSALSPNGVLILAIENKIGFKYWAGCSEDHLNKLNIGLYDYYNTDKIATFSQNELSIMLKQANLFNQSFFYCYPDYKFMSTVFSEQGDETEDCFHNWIDVPFSVYNGIRKYTFNESLLLPTLSKANLLRAMANSFVVVASKTNCLNSVDWIAKRFSMRRRRAFQCITTLYNKEKNEREVIKQAIYENCKESVNNILLKHNTKTCEYVRGESIRFDAYKLLNRGNFNALVDFFKIYHLELLNKFSIGEHDNEGFPVIKGNLLDFTLRNLIRKDDNSLICIDNEWYFETTVDFMLFRCIEVDLVEPFLGFKLESNITLTDLSYKIIKCIYPFYSKKRHRNNYKVEKQIRKEIKQINFPTVYNLNFKWLSNDKIYNFIIITWSLLPSFAKKLIHKFLKK